MEITENRTPADGGSRNWRQTVALFVLLSIFWFLLSGRLGIQYYLFLLASAGTVLWLNPQRPFPSLDPSRGAGLSGLARAGWFLVRYLVWLLWNILKANFQVARIILSPSLPVDPQFLIFRSTLKTDLARVLVANTTTLTPGTVTIDLVGNQFLVHALSPETATGLTGGDVQNVVGAIFGEDPDPAPEVTWTSTYRDLTP